MVTNVLTSIEREGEFLSRAQDATSVLLKANMARIRGLAMLQDCHRVSFSIEYVFDFSPGEETVNTRLLITANVKESVSCQV